MNGMKIESAESVQSAYCDDSESMERNVIRLLYMANKTRLTAKIKMRQKSVEHFGFRGVNVEDVAVGA
jgi:hypothetical protein